MRSRKSGLIIIVIIIFFVLFDMARGSIGRGAGGGGVHKTVMGVVGGTVWCVLFVH